MPLSQSAMDASLDLLSEMVNSNPELVSAVGLRAGRERQLLQRSPEYEQLAKNNPLMAQLMTNPEMLRQSLSPQNLRIMRELERSGALSGMGAGMGTGMGAGMGMGWGQMPGMGAPVMTSEQIRQKYPNEISQIEAMGFTVDDNLLQTLYRFQGNVEMTINFLMP